MTLYTTLLLIQIMALLRIINDNNNLNLIKSLKYLVEKYTVDQ